MIDGVNADRRLLTGGDVQWVRAEGADAQVSVGAVCDGAASLVVIEIVAEATIIVVGVGAGCLVLAVVAGCGVGGVVTCAFASEVFRIIAKLHFACRDVP